MRRLLRKLRPTPEVKDLWRNFLRATKMSWQIDRGNLVGYVIFIFVQIGSSLLGIFFGSRVLGSLFTYLASENASSRPIITYLILSVTMTTIEQIAWRCLSYFEGKSYLNWHTTVAPIVNGKIARLDIERFENSDFNKLLNKVVADYSWKPANFAYYILHFFHALARLVSTAVVLVVFAPWILPLLLLAVIPSLLVESRQAKIKWDIWSLKGDASRRYHKVTWMMQNKTDIMEMRIFGLNSYLIDFTRRMLDEFNREQQNAMTRFFKPAILTRLVEGVLVGVIELWLVRGVLSRSLSISQYSFYSGTVLQFNSSVGLVLSTLTTLYEYSLYMTDYFKLMDTEDLLGQPQQPIVLPKDTVPSITFDNVSFHYPTRKRYVFRNLNLHIEPGEKVALVGENGVGKTTLIKLLLRFYDVTDGRILVDGIDIRELDLNSWYRLIGVLFQDFSQYPFDIEDNIWLGRIHRPKDEASIKKAAHLAGLESVIAELPQGYASILDNSFDEGVEPSGGQWQRVALARAFYRQAPVLILDEPTAAIDAKAEYEIFNNIFSQHAHKTAIIVSHRFSTVRKADRILVFDKGKVLETGTHQQLMKTKGLYHEMFSKQAEGYK